ncbi:protein of unknown function [Methanoculleus bourgensis]|jgi:hypothetical protein|uniref:Uncharacterized protein n=2 Tax=Methanoculleus bourgensis TaxID=83986 RepID=A0A0X3BQD4_9EURY|nr:protein of unknown function [Methanoculleus bourgensis]
MVMVEATPEFHIVYRGMTEETAERLLNDNVFTNKGFTDTTLNPWYACEPLDQERRGSFHNLMAISLPEGAHGLYVPEQEMIVLQDDLTLKCIGVMTLNSVMIAPDGRPRNIRLFAMEVKE